MRAPNELKSMLSILGIHKISETPDNKSCSELCRVQGHINWGLDLKNTFRDIFQDELRWNQWQKMIPLKSIKNMIKNK